MRAARFAPIEDDDEALPHLAETAVFSQWFHSGSKLHYARRAKGEVDIVGMGPRKPSWAVEVKWSDCIVKHPRELSEAIKFCRENDLESLRVTTKSVRASTEIDRVRVTFVPAALHCYQVGYNLVRKLEN